MSRSRAALALLLGLGTLACVRPHEEPAAFTWTGSVPAGSWVRLRNLRGSVEVRRAPGNDIQVVAAKRWRHSRARGVRFDVVRVGDNVVVCALWSRSGRCGEETYRDSHRRTFMNLWRRTDMRVDFTVLVPPGVQVDAKTVTGNVDIAGAAAPVHAATVNGDLEVSTAVGPVVATTVNGDITARMDTLVGSGPIQLSSVNGSVTAELPAPLNGDLDLSSDNGGFASDFPITMNGAVSDRHARGTVGSGGRAIKLTTVNGRVSLRKRS
jgi:hypothetical protein